MRLQLQGILHKRKVKIGIAITAILLLLFLGTGFALLVKVKGNISYLYNFVVKTQGSLPVEYNEDAKTGADGTKAYATDVTDPANYLLDTALMVNGQEVDSYTRPDPINFLSDWLENFTSLKGIITFRGNYARNMKSYGSVHLNNALFSNDYWTVTTGKALKSDGVNYWSGNGWTGQPLIVQWDDETKQHMNLYDSAKEKEGLTEVIYPGMDGQIHFLDLETGEPTRDPIIVGMTFKGTASLYPSGIPMLICGSGDSQPGMYGEQVSARVFIYSLIDGSKLYELGANDDFAPRIWHAYDSSAIISTDTDTLIYPGENGVLYTLKLNTKYNASTGDLSVNPGELVEFTYYPKTALDRVYEGEGGYGSESSADVWGNYLFFGDNGGMFSCLDLNTMQIVWVQDVLEDVNSSPIFEEDEDGNKFVYVATTLKYHTDEHHLGEACIYKLNAMTGEIIWKKPYEVHTVLGLAGGILATGCLGEGAISDYIIYSVSKVPSVDTAYIVALNKYSGEEAWRVELDCDVWSSAVPVYDEDGTVYLIQCCNNGNILLMNALTGTILDKMNFGTVIEATPAVFGNRLVVGLRSEKIIGVEFE